MDAITLLKDDHKTVDQLFLRASAGTSDTALLEMAEDCGHVPGRAGRAPERAGDLRPAGARGVGHRHFDDPPAGRTGAEHHLERPSEAAVGDAEPGELDS